MLETHPVLERLVNLDPAHCIVDREDLNKVGERWWQMKEEISRLACLREIVTELVAAMREYEMDVDEDPPYLHRQMMERASAVIANPATAPEPAPLPHDAARCDEAEREYCRAVNGLDRAIDAAQNGGSNVCGMG